MSKYSLVTLTSVVEFLQDEGLHRPMKIKNKDNPDKWIVYINDPFIKDNKMRMGIGVKIFDDGTRKIVFNGFKSSALLGDSYHGEFFKFVQMIKHFSSRNKAEEWFKYTYILRGSGLLKKFNDSEKIVIDKRERTKIIWDDNYIKLNPKLKSHKEYLDYLIKRKISINKINSLKIFIDKKSKRLVFPVYEDNELIFYTKRLIIPPTKYQLRWVKSAGEEVYPVWNLENVNGEEIYIFEGIFDAIHINNGVAIFGTAHENVLNKIVQKKYSKYIIVMDNDEAGRKGKFDIAERLEEMKCNVFIYNYHGIPETYKDFGEMAIANIPFDLDKRILPYDLKTKAMIKMQLVR